MIKVAATDGSLVWNVATGFGWPVVTAQGDVVHVSVAPNTVTKLDGASGIAIASERITPASGDWFALSYQTSLALSAQEVVAVGQVNWNSQNRAFAVFGFGDRLSGTTLLLKDPGDPSVRTFRLTSTDRGLALPEPDDPAAPTAAGATLEITNPVTNESTSLALPAVGWTGTTPKAIGGTRYKYVDKMAANGSPSRSTRRRRAAWTCAWCCPAGSHAACPPVARSSVTNRDSSSPSRRDRRLPALAASDPRRPGGY